MTPGPGSRIRDISVVVRRGTPEWPGDTAFSCRWTWSIDNEQSVNVSAFEMSPHVGTHVDAPVHVRNGDPATESLSLEALMGPVMVLGCDADDAPLDPDALKARLPRRVERLLLRTGRSIAGGTFPDTWATVTPAGVHVLSQRGLRLLGVDAPSVDERESKSLETHRALFAKGITVLENLDLRGVPDGPYELIALPLRVEGLDAAPVRALLVEVS